MRMEIYLYVHMYYQKIIVKFFSKEKDHSYNHYIFIIDFLIKY